MFIPFVAAKNICVGGSRAKIFQVGEKKPKKERRGELLLDKIRETTVHWKKVRVPEPNTFPEAAANPHLPRR